MPKIANKGIHMPSSPIRKLVPFADQAKKEGKLLIQEVFRYDQNLKKLMADRILLITLE